MLDNVDLHKYVTSWSGEVPPFGIAPIPLEEPQKQVSFKDLPKEEEECNSPDSQQTNWFNVKEKISPLKESTLERNKLDKAMNKVFEAFTFGKKLRRKMMTEKEKE